MEQHRQTDEAWQTGSTLYLLSAPARVPGPAFALSPLANVPALTSLDRRMHWDDNRALGKELAAQFCARLEPATLSAWMTEQGLPPVDPLRMRHRRIVLECISLADLLMRLDNLLRDAQPQHIVYVGPAGWRVEAIKALCAARNISFRWQRARDSREQISTPLRVIKRYVLDVRDHMRNRRLRPLPSPAEYLVLAGSNRFSLGLFPVLEQLPGTLRIVEERSDPVAHDIARTAWRLDGARPLVRLKTSALSAQLRTQVRHALSSKPVKWRDAVLNDAGSLLVAGMLEGVILQIQAMHKVLQTHREAIIVGTSVSEHLLEVARAAGRSVAVVQTSGIWEYDLILPGAGRYFVYSDADADSLTGYGASPKQITVCGHPYYDELAGVDAASEAQRLRERFKIASSQPLILIVGNHTVPGLLELEVREDLFGEIMRGLVPVVHDENAMVLVKPHPVDVSGDFYHQLARKTGFPADRLHVLADKSLTPLIAACDVIIMSNSTAGMEAALLEKPIINVPYIKADLFDYTATGAVLTAHTAAEVSAAVAGLLHDAEVKQKLAAGQAFYRSRHLHAQDGHAAQRVVEGLECLRARKNHTPG